MPILSLFPDPRTHAMLYGAMAAVVIAVMLLRRIRVVRRVMDWAITVCLIALLVAAIAERGRFDPYFSRVANVLHLDDQQVVGKEVRIHMSPDGHFWARVRLNGVNRRMLIDSGATITALSSDTAAAAGIKTDGALFPVVLKTANGAISARTASVDDLRLGDISARDLPVVVSPAFGDTDVLGMNFLSKLKAWRVENGTLVLVPHHPQEQS